MSRATLDAARQETACATAAAQQAQQRADAATQRLSQVNFCPPTQLQALTRLLSCAFCVSLGLARLLPSFVWLLLWAVW